MKNGAFLEFKKMSTVDRMIDSMNQFMYRPHYLGDQADTMGPNIPGSTPESELDKISQR